MDMIQEIGIFIYTVLGGLFFSFGTFGAGFILLGAWPIVLSTLLGQTRKRTQPADSTDDGSGWLAMILLIPFGIPLIWLCAAVTQNFLKMDLASFVQTKSFLLVVVIWILALIAMWLERTRSSGSRT